MKVSATLHWYVYSIHTAPIGSFSFLVSLMRSPAVSIEAIVAIAFGISATLISTITVIVTVRQRQILPKIYAGATSSCTPRIWGVPSLKWAAVNQSLCYRYRNAIKEPLARWLFPHSRHSRSSCPDHSVDTGPASSLSQNSRPPSACIFQNHINEDVGYNWELYLFFRGDINFRQEIDVLRVADCKGFQRP